MVNITRSQPLRPPTTQLRKEKHKRASVVLAAIAGAASVAIYASEYTDKRPIHTSILTGQRWLQELLEGHPTRFRRQFGMQRFVFRHLLRDLKWRCGLKDTKHVTAEEQLAIFLRIARTGLGNAETQERFQRSGDTISKCFHRILNMIVSKEFYHHYVSLSAPDVVPAEIRDNSRFFPFFQACRGAVDGSLLDAFVREADMSRYRSRKGRISTNLLAACRFNMQFCYLLSGWEGSAADSRVFDNARRTDFIIAPGTYFLGDAGFPLCDACLVPYRGVRYHLNEWAQSNQRPSNYKELFNLRHASLRNVIERIFGVCKRRFRLMTIGPEYSLRTQAQIPLALAALHNFISIIDPEDNADNEYDHNDTDGGITHQREQVINPDYLGQHISQAEKDRASAARDVIAINMWDDYQRYLEEREEPLE